MSSIYKKGRDGYYYYQAYIEDRETGKKNKRVFHSLGTKNIEDAKKMKVKYDLLYDRNSIKKNITEKIFNYRHNDISIFSILILAFSLVTFFLGYSLFYKKRLVDKPKVQLSKNIEIQNDTIPKKIYKLKDEVDLKTKDSFVLKPRNLPQKHYIQRVEAIKSDFNQVKVFATIENISNADSIKQLCRNIKKMYSEYSNFIICIYSNTEIGIALANSTITEISSPELQKSWLAMYSYNEVEGEYFDDRPTSYINSYK